MKGYWFLLFYPLLEESTCHLKRMADEGTLARPGQFPYIVVLLSDNVGCTGILIEADWVLTAAHCADGVKEFVVVNGVREQGNMQVRKSERILIHPHYDKYGPSSKDLALLKLANPFNDTETVQLRQEEFPQGERVKCTSVGHKMQKAHAGYVPKDLQWADVTATRGDTRCTRLRFGRLIRLKPTDGLLGTCFGDSGPLICRGQAVGVASFVYDSYTCSRETRQEACSAGASVSAYTYIYPELKWITSHGEYIPGKSSCPQGGAVIVTSLFLIIVQFKL